MAANFNTVGQQFVSAYYPLFDANRAELAKFYIAQSMMTFEGQQFQGPEAITQKLVGLPFTTVQHVITTTDSQPTAGNGVIVFVVGQLKTDNDPPHSFSQCFTLMPNPDGSFYVLNDLFRLSLHHG